jgi:hypothetical protein
MGSTQDSAIRAEFARLSRRFQAKEAIQALAENPLGKFLGNEWISACARSPALADAEYAARLVELANAGRLPVRQFFDLAGGALLQLETDQYARIDEAALARLRGRLATIVGRDSTAIAALRQELAQELRGNVVVIPTFDPDGFRWLALDIPPALAIAVHVLLTSDLANRLCRCRYRSRPGPRFFLVDPPEVKKKRGTPQGRLRRDYCCAEHRVEEQRLSNAQRQKNIRDERKAANARKHK